MFFLSFYHIFIKRKDLFSQKPDCFPLISSFFYCNCQLICAIIKNDVLCKEGGDPLVDIHCHILPEFDDGASGPDEAVAMAHMAADSGVTAIVATPHFPGKSASLHRMGALMDRYRWLRRTIREQGLPLELYPGAEILCLPETPELAQEGLLPTIGSSSSLLTEFFFDEPFSRMDSTLDAIAGCGYLPVIAHPERYHAIQEDPNLLRRWYEKGFALQLNKGSLLGSFGPGPEETALTALRAGLAHIIASDAHSARRRTPHMIQLQMWLENNCDPDYARILLTENPSRLISGLELISAL